MVPAFSCGRDICGDYGLASRREWLVTNGIGGFASGTMSDALTRRYHGLLFAALNPPLGRTLLLAKIDADARYGGRTFALSTNAWSSGAIDPCGYLAMESFRLDGCVPVWTYALSDARLERAIWMEPGANITYVRYTLVRASASMTLSLRAIADDRDYHGSTHAGPLPDIIVEATRVTVRFAQQQAALLIDADNAQAVIDAQWYCGYELAEERERGLDCTEDHAHVATFTAALEQGQSVTLRASAGEAALQTGGALQRRQRADDAVLERWRRAQPEAAAAAPPWIEQLVRAADAFVVKRGDGSTVIAGYPWFGDWGRDTMISLAGLTLYTGRSDIARDILTTFARFVDRGMIPNRFPDASQTPEYNTIDATLWYVDAIARYLRMTGDLETARALFPVISQIVDWHQRGTRYNIRADKDGLLYGGQPGVQLTWMDAKVGDDVITPRQGKPVEVNALWYNALRCAAEIAALLDEDSAQFERAAQLVQNAFPAFWNDATGYCFDVIAAPLGNDAAIRPNAVIAAGVHYSPLTLDRQKAILMVAERELLTSIGLRSLAPSEPQFIGSYGGDQRSRDGAYHQGTIWPWLLGPYIAAFMRVYNDRAGAQIRLEPLRHALWSYGLGTLPEIAAGSEPFAPNGCIAQAWSVAEALRVWHEFRLY